MTDSELQVATDAAMAPILNANAVRVFENDELKSPIEPVTYHSNTTEPCCVHNCRVTTNGYITSQSLPVEHGNLQTVARTKVKIKKTTPRVVHRLPTDYRTIEQIEESKEDFDNGCDIINHSLRSDMAAIEEVENYLNQKEIFLDADKDGVHWQQDLAHDQTRFHFVLLGKKEDRSRWLASDARYVRTRLAELVGNLAYELKILKAAVK